MLLKQIVLSQPFGSAFDFVSLQSPKYCGTDHHTGHVRSTEPVGQMRDHSFRINAKMHPCVPRGTEGNPSTEEVGPDSLRPEDGTPDLTSSDTILCAAVSRWPA